MQLIHAIQMRELPRHCEIGNGTTACFLSKLSILSVLIFSTTAVNAAEFFNPAFISNNPEDIADLSRFDKGEGQPAGEYRVEIFLNDQYFATQDMMFNIRKTVASTTPVVIDDFNKTDDTGLEACLNIAQLKKLNVNLTSIPSLNTAKPEDCVHLEETIAQASSLFDFEKQRLYISIPQAMLKNSARGYIPPDEWDEGINSLLLSYNLTGSNSKNTDSGNKQHSNFLSLNSGANIGPWRLRNFSTASYSRGSKSGDRKQWQNISTYLQRSITPLKSTVVIGDSNTSNDIFNSLGFRGVALGSDERMQPDSLRGFAPTVRGVAASNAKVTIKQNGYVVYQSYVPAGAFEINDLYSSTTSGDLTVAITEVTGKTSSFVVPYSTVPLLQREGQFKYSLVAGQFRSGNTQQTKPNFAQSTLIWGLPNGVTIYGGTQFANSYKSAAFGTGMNLGTWGGISTDITHAESLLPDDTKKSGQSLRFLYAKSLNEWGTTFQLLGYRYSTQGFYTLDETTYKNMTGTLDQEEGDRNGNGIPLVPQTYNLSKTKKGRMQVSISQQLGDSGSLFMTGSRQTYWQTPQTDDLWQVGYNGYWDDINYSLSLNYSKNPYFKDADKRIALTVSLPIGKWLTGGRGADITRSSNTAYATYSASSDDKGQVNQQVGVSGSLLRDNNLTYGVQQGYATKGSSANGNVSLSYQGRIANVNAGYNYNKGWQQLTYSLAGGAVAHADGITLSQPLGDTNVLIKAPGASGVDVENSTGISTDWRGYAVIPYATSYRFNRIALDSKTLKDDADLEDTVSSVVPTQGAIVRASFVTRIGTRALLTLLQMGGKPVPFGAIVERADKGGSGIVGDNGQVYLAGLPPQGSLKVKWGNAAHQTCDVQYQLLPNSEKQAITYATAKCWKSGK